MKQKKLFCISVNLEIYFHKILAHSKRNPKPISHYVSYDFPIFDF